MAQPKRKGKQQDPYDTMFDVLFGKYRSPRQNIIPGRSVTMPGMGGFARNLAEIAMGPAIYGVEEVLNDIEAEAKAFGSIKSEPLKDFKVEVTPGNLSRFIANPRKTIDKAYAKYKAGKKWGRIGGSYRVFDSAIIAVAGKKAGLSGREAWRMGSVVRGMTSGVYTPGDTHKWRYDAAKRIEENVVTVASERHGIAKADMQQIIDESRNLGDKSNWDSNSRYAHTVNRLRARGVAADEARALAKDLWGEQIADRQIMKGRLERNWGLSQADARSLSDDIWSQRDKFARGSKDDMEKYLRKQGIPRGDARAIAKDFKDSWDKQGIWAPGQSAKNDKAIRAADFNSSKKVLDARVSTMRDNLATLQARAVRDPRAERELEREIKRMEAYGNKIQRYFNYMQTGKGIGGIYGLGMTVGKIQHLRAISADVPGNLRSALFTGNTVAIINLMSLPGGGFEGWDPAIDITSPGKLSFDNNKGIQGVFHKAANDSLRARTAEWIYYYHPVNLVKGLVWDGRTWGKLATRADSWGMTGARDVFMNIARFTPKQILLSRIKFPNVREKVNEKVRELMGKAFSKFLGRAAGDLALLPIKEIIKQVIIKALAQVIGNSIAPVIGGIVIAAAGFVIEKLAKPLMELAVLVIFGIIALVAFGSINIFNGVSPTQLFSRHLNPPITYESPYGMEIYSQDEWATESIPPAGYSGLCVVTSSTTWCTQGPCGGTSHGPHNSRAVDLTWSGMAANPGFVAPSDGRVISSRTSSTCRSDGTNYGGVVVFEDSEGYVWTFMHVRPVATGDVTAGQVIGEVQYVPEVQVGDCYSGAHLHLQIENPSGRMVDAEEFLNNAGCNFSCPVADQC